MGCDIIMVTWNEAAMTERALESIQRNADYPYRLIVVDNASDADTIALLERAEATRRFGHMVLVQNRENVGWIRGVNQGIALSDAEYVCLMNNDIQAGPGWLQKMVATIQRVPDAGIAGPEGDTHRQKRAILDVDAHARRLAEAYAGQFTEVESCSGFCMLLTRSVINRLGRFDEIYNGGYGEDGDYCLKAWKAGYRCIRCQDAFVLHLGSRSFGKMPEKRQALADRNTVIFESRWGKKRRLLVMARYFAAEDLIRMVRNRHIIYVIQNRYAHSGIFPCRHVNLRFRGIRFPFLDSLQFLLQAAYLCWRRRIDAALIAYSAAAFDARVGLNGERGEPPDTHRANRTAR